MPVMQGFANPLLLQTDIAVNDSRAVLRASNATNEANDQGPSFSASGAHEVL